MSTGNEPLDYEAGQFLTIDPHQFPDLERFTCFLEDLKGRKEPPRPYSMSSAPHEPHVAITVKEEHYNPGTTKYPPLLSPLLVSGMRAGTRLVITGFTGGYTLNSKIRAKTSHLFHICAGSGIVPNFAIIKSALAVRPEIQHMLLYSSRTWDDIIFRSRLEALSRKYPDQLRVVHTLTREKDIAARCPNVRTGRVGIDVLKELIPATLDCHFFVCGPGISVYEQAAAKEKGVSSEPRFMESVIASLKQLGVSSDQITHESYG